MARIVDPRPIRRIGAVLLAMLLAAPGAAQDTAPTPAPAPAAAAQPAPCADAQFAAFDFWVGDWDVRPYSGDKTVARSRIEKLYGGCAVRENWMPANGQEGGSLSSFDRDSGRWRQTWVDSGGSWLDLIGDAGDGRMVMAGTWHDVLGPGRDGLVQVTWSPEQGGAVRQKGVVSEDKGANWKPLFDFLYVRRVG